MASALRPSSREGHLTSLEGDHANMNTWLKTLLALLLACVVAAAGSAGAQSAPPQAGGKPFSQEELDQVLAPVALYPDSLLAQIFMASTYPLEVVSAANWVKANPKTTGKALESAMQKQTWDPSV